MKKTILNSIYKRVFQDYTNPFIVYHNIIHDNPLNESSKTKIEMVQYNTALIIVSAIKETFYDKLYKEFGLESSVNQKWSQKLLS